MKKNLRQSVFCAILFIIGSLSVYGQVPPPSTSGPSCWPPPCVPIDGGISALIVAGAALGAKKFYDFKKKSSQI